MLAARIKELYAKREVRIRVRDGVQLFTSIYVPKDTTRRYPVLMSRTPYSVSPYGADYKPALGPSGNRKWVDDGYIFVYQDVRGRNFSEGIFRDMTPILEKHNKPTDVDEGTDAYDSIDWLVNNLPTNGKVGIYGTSYPGFYTTASCLSRHPALAACSPQAPMTDIWMGTTTFTAALFCWPTTLASTGDLDGRPAPNPDPIRGTRPRWERRTPTSTTWGWDRWAQARGESSTRRRHPSGSRSSRIRRTMPSGKRATCVRIFTT